MLRGVGDPVDVHEVDDALMLEAIARLQDFGALNRSTAIRPEAFEGREVERLTN